MKYIYLITFLLFSSFAFAQVTWTVECANPKEIVDNSCVGCDKSELFYGIVLNGSDGRVKYLPKHTTVSYKNGTHVFLNGNAYPLSIIDNASTPEEFTALLDCLSGGIVPPPIITTLVNNGDGTATYTNEEATATTFQLGWTTVTSNADGSYTFTYPDGATDEIPADCCPTLVANADGSYTFTGGDGSSVVIEGETVTTIVDNGNGSFSYTNEDGVVVTYGQPIELAQEISGDSIITTVVGELGTTDQSYVTITNETVTDVIDNVQYFITTTTDENGNEIIDTTGCKALPPNYISSLVNDTYIIETGCDTSFLDIFANDTECFDPITGEVGPRSYTVILSSITYEGCFLDIDLDGAGADVLLADCQSAPNTCTFDYTDGKDTATVTILTVPDPVGVIRLTKSNNAPNNEVESGDVFDYTYVICNDPNATGPITDISFVDILDLSCFGNVTVDDAVDQNSNIVGGTGYDNVSGEMNFDWVGPLNVGECVSFDANVTVVKASGFEFIPNIASVEGNDGVNGPASTTASALDVVNEKEFAEARLRWGEPDANGIVTTTSQEYVKQPSGALIQCGATYSYEHWIDEDEDGVKDLLWETITGTLCGSNYVTDRTDGLSITDFNFTGDFGNGLNIQYDHKSWKLANGYYASTCEIQNCRETISTITVGGNGDPICPVASSNTDNTSLIKKACCLGNIDFGVHNGLTINDFGDGLELMFPNSFSSTNASKEIRVYYFDNDGCQQVQTIFNDNEKGNGTQDFLDSDEFIYGIEYVQEDDYFYVYTRKGTTGHNIWRFKRNGKCDFTIPDLIPSNIPFVSLFNVEFEQMPVGLYNGYPVWVMPYGIAYYDGSQYVRMNTIGFNTLGTNSHDVIIEGNQICIYGGLHTAGGLIRKACIDTATAQAGGFNVLSNWSFVPTITDVTANDAINNPYGLTFKESYTDGNGDLIHRFYVSNNADPVDGCNLILIDINSATNELIAEENVFLEPNAIRCSQNFVIDPNNPDIAYNISEFGGVNEYNLDPNSADYGTNNNYNILYGSPGVNNTGDDICY